MDVLLIKGDTASNVRLAKYIKVMSSESINVSFWGWDRTNKNEQIAGLIECSYLLKGGGFGSKRLLFLYPLWIIKVFFKALFCRFLSQKNIIAINFDLAFPIYLASILANFEYIYEIHDEFALSYNFNKCTKKFIRYIDKAIMKRAKFVIHVDENRVNYDKCNSIIIENSPEDYFKGKSRKYNSLQRTFAVIGNISKTRGIDQIYKFAKDNKDIKILLVGKFYDENLKRILLSLDNIIYKDYMPQQELFSNMVDCCGIFSLYDPCLEINRLAASNKVYDAMMLGIPVITNREVINSKFIERQNIGIVINYKYDSSWDILSSKDFLDIASKIGQNGRELYLQEYQFDKMLKNRLITKLS